MHPLPDDWRIQGQEKYLFRAILSLKKYSDKKMTTDHDHCEFCMNKFSNTIPDALTAGYTTQDNYRWICKKCFEDFKSEFEFSIRTT